MLDSDNSYIRTRGLVLLACHAKWDVDYKIDELITDVEIVIFAEMATGKGRSA